MEVKARARAETVQLARAAGLVSSMTLVSRLLGLVREQVFAALLGAGYHSDAFRDRLPHPEPAARPLRRRGALGRVRAHLRPDPRRSSGQEEAFRLANRLLTFLAVVLGAGRGRWRSSSPGRSWRTIAPGFDDAPGKAELDRAADARDDALPAARVVRGRGDGHAQRRGALRHPGAVAGALQRRHDRVGRRALGPGPQPRAGRARLGGRHARRRARAVPGPAALAAATRLALPRGVGARRSGAAAGGTPDGPGHGGPGGGAGEHLREQRSSPRSEPGAVSWLEYAFRLLYLPIGALRRRGRHDRHGRPRAPRGRGRPRGAAHDARASRSRCSRS